LRRASTWPNAERALSVLSANLWHDWPRQRRWLSRLEALAQLVEAERAEVVLLQEVTRTRTLRADEWLAGRLNMHCLYARANGHRAVDFEEGVAVLSRFPLGEALVRQFRARLNPFVRRVALGTVIATPNGPVAAVSVHLSLTPGRNARQLAALPGWVSGLAGSHPAVIGGDFNAPEHRRGIQRARLHWLDTFRSLHPDADGATHELHWLGGRTLRRQRLDYIFWHPGQHPWHVLEARHLRAPSAPHSDHLAVVARLAPH
jgi:endonuclease/exonuclease/phosphatase family metal-dependent hydrolase